MKTRTAKPAGRVHANQPLLLCSLTALAMLSASYAYADHHKLTVAIATDMPPYVSDSAKTGLEVDIVKKALDGYVVEFVQMPYSQLQDAVQKQKADVSIGVVADNTDNSDVFYSDPLISFANFAISKKSDNLDINNMDDLKKYQVLTWQNAYLELGDEFKKLFSPESEYRKNYHEFSDQAEQVAHFWKESQQVAIIDRNIFAYFTKALKPSDGEVVHHSLFPTVTNFSASFKDESAMKAFNSKLKAMCQSGEYGKLLEEYEVQLETTVCGDK